MQGLFFPPYCRLQLDLLPSEHKRREAKGEGGKIRLGASFTPAEEEVLQAAGAEETWQPRPNTDDWKHAIYHRLAPKAEHYALLCGGGL